MLGLLLTCELAMVFSTRCSSKDWAEFDWAWQKSDGRLDDYKRRRDRSEVPLVAFVVVKNSSFSF